MLSHSLQNALHVDTFIPLRLPGRARAGRGLCLHKHPAPAQRGSSQAFLGRATGATPKDQVISISPPQPKQDSLVEGICSVSLLGSPQGWQDTTCILACLTSKPKPPGCTCISETAPSHPRTRSRTPHRRGTGLCAATRPPAGSRQACRPAGTLPACLAQRRGCRPGSVRRTHQVLQGKESRASMPTAQGTQGHLPGPLAPAMPWKFQPL